MGRGDERSPAGGAPGPRRGAGKLASRAWWQGGTMPHEPAITAAAEGGNLYIKEGEMMRLKALVPPVLAASAVFLAAPGGAQPPAPRPERATLVVRLPAAAKLEIDGDPTRPVGALRNFTSPPLTPGKSYYYTLVARWEPNNYTKITRTRRAYVSSGKETVADLTKPDPAQPDEIVIRYVPTPPDIVDAMMRLGK